MYVSHYMRLVLIILYFKRMARPFDIDSDQSLLVQIDTRTDVENSGREIAIWTPGFIVQCVLL